MATGERDSPSEQVPPPPNPTSPAIGAVMLWDGIISIGALSGALALAAARWFWTRPKAVDQRLKSALGDGNELLHRFVEVLLVTAIAACLVLVLLSPSCWFWCSAAFWVLSVGAVLLIAGGINVARSRDVGGGVAAVGLVLFLAGVPFTGVRFCAWAADQWEQRQIRLANEQVAACVKTTQQDFDAGDLDKAEHELKQVLMISKATDKQAAKKLQDEVAAARQSAHEAAVKKANSLVYRLVGDARDALQNGDIEAKSMLAKASAMPNATNKAEVERVRSRIPTAIAEKHRKEANDQVKLLMLSATRFFEAGQSEQALRKVDESLAIKDATDVQEIENLVGRMGAGLPESWFRAAKQAIEQMRFSMARKWLKDYVTKPNVTRTKEASDLLTLLDVVCDAEKAQKFLRSMDALRFNEFAEQRKLLDGPAADSSALAEATKVALAGQLDKERSRRQAEREKEEVTAPEVCAKRLRRGSVDM